jgi:hypothetical protein
MDTLEKMKAFLEKSITDVKVKPGKMHKALGIEQGKDISDVYDSGEKLAKALLNKVGRKEAAGMINYAANISKKKNIFDAAQKYLSDTSEED